MGALRSPRHVQRRLRRGRAAGPVVVFVLVAVLVLSGGAAHADYHQSTAGRMQGADNVAAAIAMSNEVFPPQAAKPARVLLARDDDFADALASAGAQHQGGMPLLLTARDSLDPRVAEELDRLGVADVTVLGGDAAVSPAVVAALEASGRTVERVAGPTRIDTAVAIVERFLAQRRPASVVIVRAFPDAQGDPTRAFADALGGGSLPTVYGPILLTEAGALSAPTRVYLESEAAEHLTHVFVLGGAAAVSDAVVGELEALGVSVERVAGPDRYATAAEAAVLHAWTVRPGWTHRVLLIDGQRPDAWAPGFSGALLSLSSSASILLAAGPDLPEPTRQFLAGAKQNEAFGGLTCAPYVHADACSAAEAVLRG